MPGASLIDQFASLDDPHQSWKALSALPEILLLVLCGTLAGAGFCGDQALGPDAPVSVKAGQAIALGRPRASLDAGRTPAHGLLVSHHPIPYH